MIRSIWLLGLALAMTIAGCGGNSRTRSLNTTLAGVDAMRSAFITFDEAAQELIVDHATSLEDGQAKLGEYRSQRADSVLAFELAYRALALAYADKADLAEVIDAATKLTDAFNALKAWQGDPS